jgi:hypothetical protein
MSSPQSSVWNSFRNDRLDSTIPLSRQIQRHYSKCRSAFVAKIQATCHASCHRPPEVHVQHWFNPLPTVCTRVRAAPVLAHTAQPYYIISATLYITENRNHQLKPKWYSTWTSCRICNFSSCNQNRKKNPGNTIHFLNNELNRSSITGIFGISTKRAQPWRRGTHNINQFIFYIYIAVLWQKPTYSTPICSNTHGRTQVKDKVQADPVQELVGASR